MALNKTPSIERRFFDLLLSIKAQFLGQGEPFWMTEVGRNSHCGDPDPFGVPFRVPSAQKHPKGLDTKR
jgi:hypothetical protein